MWMPVQVSHPIAQPWLYHLRVPQGAGRRQTHLVELILLAGGLRLSVELILLGAGGSVSQTCMHDQPETPPATNVN